MAIRASSESIRDMKATLQKTVRDIQVIQTNVKGAMRASSGWNDAQGQQYQALMQQIARLTDSPTHTLQAAIPKLEKLAQSLDAYGKVRF